IVASFVDLSRTPVRTSSPPCFSPRIESTTEFQAFSILGLFLSRSCTTFEARKVSRRWIKVTLLANRVRNVASSTAESPPPTTAISFPRYRAPSQVAQVLTPLPRYGPSMPSHRADAPVATIRALAVQSRSVPLEGSPLGSSVVRTRN